MVHPHLLLVTSTQDEVDIVMGAVAVDVVVVAAAPTPFANHMAARGGGFQGACRASFQDVGCAQYPVQQMNPPHSNVTKKYSNWNVYYLCGFDIEDGHTLSTCLWDWQKLSHIEGFTQANAQSYIAGGHDCCTKGMHKNVFLSPAAF
jgi:hypothetical protein